jgi:hypothetical protein
LELGRGVVSSKFRVKSEELRGGGLKRKGGPEVKSLFDERIATPTVVMGSRRQELFRPP